MKAKKRQSLRTQPEKKGGIKLNYNFTTTQDYAYENNLPLLRNNLSKQTFFSSNHRLSKMMGKFLKHRFLPFL